MRANQVCAYSLIAVTPRACLDVVVMAINGCTVIALLVDCLTTDVNEP